LLTRLISPALRRDGRALSLPPKHNPLKDRTCRGIYATPAGALSVASPPPKRGSKRRIQGQGRLPDQVSGSALPTADGKIKDFSAAPARFLGGCRAAPCRGCGGGAPAQLLPTPSRRARNPDVRGLRTEQIPSQGFIPPVEASVHPGMSSPARGRPRENPCGGFSLAAAQVS